jgi:chemotaxis protein MotB
MNFFHAFGIAILCCLGFASCVKKSLYQAEYTAHQALKAKETILAKELTDRKSEQADLIKQIGDLNKTIGHQEGDIAQLRSEIVLKSTASGETVTQLMSEKDKLINELNSVKRKLDECNGQRAYVKSRLQERSQVTESLKQDVIKQFVGFSQVTTNVNNGQILLTIPDAMLFEANGLVISKSGRDVLDQLAKMVASRPSLDIDIVAYTDNVLPKGAKNLTDTWDWSLQRAVSITRLLISEYGVNANQLTPVGRGEFYPVASNETPEGRSQNRRSVIIFKPEYNDLPVME